jgi:hypothetical protein
MSGWIKIHRQIVDWEWFSDTNTFRVFLQLLLKANHKEKKYRGMDLKIGTIITSRDILAMETGLSVRQVRTALDKLKSTNEVTIKTSSQGTIIEVVNYAKYQLTTSETTNERPTNDQQTTTNKNVKNVKNERSIFIEPTYNDILEYCSERKNGVDVNKFLNFYSAKGWFVGKNKMIDWKACVRTWEKPIEIQEVNEPKKWKAPWS